MTAIDVSFLRPVILHLTDRKTTALLSEAVTAEELPCLEITDKNKLLSAAQKDQPSLVMVEHDPPQFDGREMAQAIRLGENNDSNQVPIVLVTTGNHWANDNEKGVATDWLVMPFSQGYARSKILAWTQRTACRWVRAQLPPDEPERLAALKELAILDTVPEDRFDRITRIAASSLGVPIVLISLVDSERQWFKSCYGLNAKETSRDAAFCSHVVYERKELIVPDALLDDRFADNPFVLKEPRIRFYAGAPLILDNGSCIGTLCAIDTRPRDLSHDDLVVLRDLRDMVMEEIKRNRT